MEKRLKDFINGWIEDDKMYEVEESANCLNLDWEKLFGFMCSEAIGKKCTFEELSRVDGGPAGKYYTYSVSWIEHEEVKNIIVINSLGEWSIKEVVIL